MVAGERMKAFLRRFGTRKQGPHVETDLEELAPLVHLIEPIDPDVDLLGRIERGIDSHEGVGSQEPRPRRWTRKTLAALFVLGVIAGAGAMGMMQSRQQVVTQISPSSPWIPLGSVTLHGGALRDFVRAKCKGQTHFFITMHGFHIENTQGVRAAPLLMEDEEKIRMACIF